MARSRNIKPGFFINPELAELPFEYRLLFIGLWTLADREGRLEDRAKRIKMALFAADSVDCEAGLVALACAGFITRYTAQGVAFLAINNWHKHQTPHPREQASTIPAPESMSKDITCDPCMGEPRTDQSTTKDIASPSDVLIPSSLSPSDSPFLGRAGAPEAIADPEKPTPPEKQVARGTRLPLDWTLPDGWITDAVQINPFWTPQQCHAVAESFRDYWIAKPGKDGVKANWQATWRNWVRREGANGAGNRSPPNGVTPYQQMQIEKHEERKRFTESMRRSRNEPTNRTPIDITPERVD